MAPSKKNEKNPPLSSTMFINWFEGSYGTFGEEKNIHYHQQHWVNLPLKKKSFKKINNDHGGGC